MYRDPNIKWASKGFGASLIKSASLSVGGNELLHVTGDGKAIIQHEGGDVSTCHFCKKKDMLVQSELAEDFQYFYGTYHKYTKYDKFYKCGVWKAYQGKNGNQIDEMSDEYAKISNEYFSR